jgi:hypothetical protein
LNGVENNRKIKKIRNRFNQGIVRHEIGVQVKRNPGVLCQ